MKNLDETKFEFNDEDFGSMEIYEIDPSEDLFIEVFASSYRM